MDRVVSTSEEEARDEYAAMLSDLQSGECTTINEREQVFFCGYFLGQIGKNFTERFVFFRIRQEMERANFFPNIYRINDHGNVSLLNGRGEEVRAWV